MTDALTDTVRRMTDEKLATWQARAFIAVQDPSIRGQCPGCKFRVLRMILRAALNIPTSVPGKIEVPHLGGEAMISKGKGIFSRYTDPTGTDMGAMLVCSVDQLNAALQWLYRAIDATAEECTAIVNTINAWISRDFSQMEDHIERAREDWKH